MKIGIDYDGVIADVNEIKGRWIKENLGIILPKWRLNSQECVPIIGEENYKKMNSVIYTEKSTLEALEIKDVADCLKELKRENLVYIITARPEKEKSFAQKWLSRHNLLGILSGIYGVGQDVTDAKAGACKELGLDALVDDHLSNLLNGFPKIRILLRDGSPEIAEMPDGVEYARNWHEVMEKLSQQKE